MQYTESMENILFQKWNELDDCNDDYHQLISLLNEETMFRTFGDGLLVFLQKNQPEISHDQAIKYIKRVCEKEEVPVKAIASSNTLKNWFDGGPRPKKGEDARDAMFALAFALSLTPKETAELFHKVYLDRAFDYRNSKELIYYFCLQNQRSWADAQRLIASSKGLSAVQNDFTVYTRQIKSDVDSMADEEALLSYIGTHGHNFSKKNVKAKENVAGLIEQAKETSEQETKLIEMRETAAAHKLTKKELYEDSPELEQYRNTNAQSLNHLYETITGQQVRGGGAKGTKTIFKNVRLPKEIKSRFPEAVTLSKKDPTYEELRKLLIMLFSYDFWYQMQTHSVRLTLDDYVDALNAYLDESGMSPLYYGNPYDWLFLYCTLTDRPLDTFRGVLAEVLDEDAFTNESYS